MRHGGALRGCEYTRGGPARQVRVPRIDDRGAPPEAEPVRRALLRPGDLDHPEGVHQRQVLAGLGVPIGPQQGEGVAAGVHRGLFRPFSRSPSILVMRLPKWSRAITTPLTASCSTAGSSTQAGMSSRLALAQVRRHAAAGGQLRSDGREDVPAVEGGAGAANAEVRQAGGGEPHDRGPGLRATMGASSPLSGARNTWPFAVTATISREVPTPGSTTATWTVPAGK